MVLESRSKHGTWEQASGTRKQWPSLQRVEHLRICLGFDLYLVMPVYVIKQKQDWSRVLGAWFNSLTSACCIDGYPWIPGPLQDTPVLVGQWEVTTIMFLQLHP